MPFPRTRPLPCSRIVELLAEAKRVQLAQTGTVTQDDFDRAWEQALAVMRTEKAFPHATEHRRQWHAALEATRPEFEACFLGRSTPFGFWSVAIIEGVARVECADAVVGRAVA